MESVITCTCDDWRRVRAPELFIEFKLRLQIGDLQWCAFRRFSEFAALRRQLGSRLAPAREPLPGKQLLRHTVDPEELRTRAPALAQWLTEVLQAEDALSELVLLEFVGLASSLPDSAGTRRAPVHVSMLRQIAETGDLMLFRSRAAVPAMQRAVTRSD